MKKRTTKAQKMFHISACILVLEIRKGHLAWKVTELVKKAGTSRALIYHYFGSNREKMLKVAVSIFVSHFYGFDDDTSSFIEMVERARRYVIDYPDIALFYQKMRTGNSELALEFQSVERRFRKRLEKKYPHFSTEQILTLHTCIHGIVTAPFLSVEDSVNVCKILLNSDYFSKNRTN